MLARRVVVTFSDLSQYCQFYDPASKAVVVVAVAVAEMVQTH